MVRGPMMAEVTAGWRVTNEMAIWTRVIPDSAANAPRASAASSLAAFSGRLVLNVLGKR
jgi:hypothetical protein